MAYSTDPNLVIIPPSRRMPTLSDAVGELADTISGRKKAADQEAQRERMLKGENLRALSSGLTYAQKKKIFDANPDVGAVATPEVDNSDDVKDAYYRRIMTTPDDQLSEPEKMAKYTVLGVHFGEAGGNAMTAYATQGTPAMVASSQVSSGQKESANNAASVAERKNYHDKRAAQLGAVADATVDLRKSQKNANDALTTKRQQPLVPKGDPLKDFNDKLRKLSAAESTLITKYNSETDPAKKAAHAQGLKAVRDQIKLWMDRRAVAAKGMPQTVNQATPAHDPAGLFDDEDDSEE